MRRLLLVLLANAMGLMIVGCGPLQSPMPPRLDDAGQKSVDDAWEKALAPVNRQDHQALLDILMGSQAYQVGVDKLTLQSEKRFSGGTVVMEIHFDRQAPAQDRFEVKIMDKVGQPLRNERYSRDDVEKTYRELFVEPEQLRQKQKQGNATMEEIHKLAALEARLAAIESAFPKDKKAEGPKENP